MESVTALPGQAVSLPTTPLQDLTSAGKSASATGSNALDKDAFLKLLVAQLKYQDPLNPSDPADFMATTAQFTTIEKLDELTTQGANNAIVTGLSMASSLVGRSVSYLGPGDVMTTGVVESAQVIGGQVRLMTSAGPVDMASILSIGAATSSTSSTNPPTQAASPETPTATTKEVTP